MAQLQAGYFVVVGWVGRLLLVLIGLLLGRLCESADQPIDLLASLVRDVELGLWVEVVVIRRTGLLVQLLMLQIFVLLLLFNDALCEAFRCLEGRREGDIDVA